MKTRMVRIGNSWGIRIPKRMLDEAGLHDEVEVEVWTDGIRIRPGRSARAGWGPAAVRLPARGEDRLLDAETSTAFDEDEWEW